MSDPPGGAAFWQGGRCWKLSPFPDSLMSRVYCVLFMRISQLFRLSVLASLTAWGLPFWGQQIPAAPPTPQEHVTHLANLGQAPTSTAKSSGNLLPDSFGGWTIQASPQISKDPSAADPTGADLLKEYGFTDFEGATYTRDDGRKLTIRAARFADATGAYGSFTFYKSPEMLNENIGDQGYSLNNRILFYRGNILIDAAFEKLTAMSAAELRELAAGLMIARGNAANLPALPKYLPKDYYLKNTSRYIVGPIALEKLESPISTQLVNFAKGAEVEQADYNISGTPATLTLINYPTPQIAEEQLKQIETASQNHQLGTTPISARRTGPILAVLSGAVSNSDARSLLGKINYDADVIWNQNTYFTRRDNAANLIVGVIMLAAIICGIAVVAGIAFGGFRILMKRLFPDKIFDRPEQMEIIALHLSDPVRKQGDSA